MDPLGSPQKGEVSPFVNSFATNDAALGILRQVRQQGLRFGTGDADLRTDRPQLLVRVANNTANDWPIWGPVTMQGIVVSGMQGVESAINEQNEEAAVASMGQLVLQGLPAAGPSAPNFDCVGICREPIPAGTIGLATIAGYTLARVLFTTGNERLADVTAGNYTYLTAGETGPARIDTYRGVAGVELCLVLLALQAQPEVSPLHTGSQGFLDETATPRTMTIVNGRISSIT